MKCGTCGRPVVFAFGKLDKDCNCPAIKEEGTKHDSQKIRLELLPTEALEEVAKVLAFGAKKYDDWNWAKGMAYSRLIGAFFRHSFAWARGIDKDQETTLSHLSHAACCILFLITYELKGLGTDDRPKINN